ncbi:hypothetical protein Poli38472_005264 [Pythium oligandrum]|uniref:3'-5' exonuclease domain-containing protein n=1 Tax=Pythium oligandrum TaxID=41045 RepID=A0A8K1CFQ7_PYTOL|nr:hypothetical protein Poli38472_005264 [Pythium oligandrum]|eukprot:TMW62646.1 hypothetical protein Poli38472_005264 [Pythium oligandrum]
MKAMHRWMKAAFRKEGQKDLEMVEKAFAFVEWMVLLSTSGDNALQINVRHNLQPSYGLNTIATASLRAGSIAEASRALDLYEVYGFEPDVFTLTSRIDVAVRSGDVHDAIAQYESMRKSKTRPNIVTFTTILRGIASEKDIQPVECLRFLSEAREEGATDEHLYLEALEVCVKRQDATTFSAVMTEIQTHGVHAMETNKFAQLQEQARACFPDTVQLTKSASRCAGSEDGPSTKPQAKHSQRDLSDVSLIQLEMNRLIERLVKGSKVTTNDFETLIHQCRKRKRKEALRVIFDTMERLATEGYDLILSSEGTETTLPPQPHLLPTIETYIAMVDAYLELDGEELAWQAFLDVSNRAQLRRQQALYRRFIHGCYVSMQCKYIPELLQLIREEDNSAISLTHRMCVELARMHGHQHLQGMDIVLNGMPDSISHEQKQQYMEELVTSCAYKDNARGVAESIQALIDQGFQLSTKTEMAVIICCLQHQEIEGALETLRGFQDQGLVLDIPTYASLLREMYFKHTRRGKVFDETSRRLALRFLLNRTVLFDQVDEERDAIQSCLIESSETNQHDGVSSDPLCFWCQHHDLQCSPLLFLQHVMELTNIVQGKEAMLAAQDAIGEALESTPDPLLFVLRAITQLPSMDRNYRGQAVIAKRLFAALKLDHDQIEDHHFEFSFNSLEQLTVHLFKEVDDALHLHEQDETRVLAFCLDALETESIDKVLGYIMSKESLNTAETAEFLLPRLAQLYAVDGVVTVLQFFKPDSDHIIETRRSFLREVITLEQEIATDEEKSTLPLTRRAILDFKLEHEAEFMPFVMAPVARASFQREDEDTGVNENLSLPLDAGQVVIVDNDDAVRLAYDVLMQENLARVGIDAEWRPDSGRGYAPSKCSLLQIACDSHVFLFDLLAIPISDLEELFSHIWTSPVILKLGYALDGDIKRLQWTFPEETCFKRLENIQDLSDLASTTAPDKNLRGLSALAMGILGVPLDKRQQTSDWERRPLTPEQIAYAALDAFCLLLLHDSFQHYEVTVTLGNVPSSNPCGDAPRAGRGSVMTHR